MIRCFVVDDEPLARRHIANQLERESDFQLVQSVPEASRALFLARTDPPDLIFLDVRMPGMGGMEFLAALRAEFPVEHRPYVILVTAFDRYALQAFEYEALDYLVKPFSHSRFQASLARARSRIESRRKPVGATPLVEDSSHKPLRLRVGSKEQFIGPGNIVWVEAADHYLYVHVNQRSHMVRMTMAAMQQELSELEFLRVHRGALVNPAFVTEVHPKSDGGRWIVLMDGSRIPVSRRRWPEIKERLMSS